jgi:hypothetical protein
MAAGCAAAKMNSEELRFARASICPGHGARAFPGSRTPTPPWVHRVDEQNVPIGVARAMWRGPAAAKVRTSTYDLRLWNISSVNSIAPRFAAVDPVESIGYRAGVVGRLNTAQQRQQRSSRAVFA